MIANRLIAVVAALALGLAAPSAALANTCVNVKRPAESHAPLTTKGNWVSVGDAWLFITPGTNVEEEFGVPIAVPGESGNFTKDRLDLGRERPL